MFGRSKRVKPKNVWSRKTCTQIYRPFMESPKTPGQESGEKHLDSAEESHGSNMWCRTEEKRQPYLRETDVRLDLLCMVNLKPKLASQVRDLREPHGFQWIFHFARRAKETSKEWRLRDGKHQSNPASEVLVQLTFATYRAVAMTWRWNMSMSQV